MGRTPQYLKRAILDAAEKKEGWFLARDIVAEVAGITGRLARPLNSIRVGCILGMLAVDGFIERELTEGSDESVRYRYRFKGKMMLYDRGRKARVR